MPKLNRQQILVLFFSSGLLLGFISPWGGLAILVTMIILDHKKVFTRGEVTR